MENFTTLVVKFSSFKLSS